MGINFKLSISMTNFADQLAELKSHHERLNWLKHFFDRLELAFGKKILVDLSQIIELSGRKTK